MSWHLGTLCAFDLETTGVDVEADRIVTACVARVDGSGKSRPAAKRWLVDPGIDIPAGATEIHGVTTERARAEGQDPVSALAEITDMLARALEGGAPVVGFNVSYDLTLLDRECRRYGLPTLDEVAGGVAPVIDARVLDKQVSHRRGPRKLADVAAFWNVGLDSAHDATADAWAAAGVACRIAASMRPIAAMSLAQLHTAQIAWKREQDLSFADHLRGLARRSSDVDEQIELNRRADGITGDWPVVPFQRQEVMADAKQP